MVWYSESSAGGCGGQRSSAGKTVSGSRASTSIRRQLICAIVGSWGVGGIEGVIEGGGSMGGRLDSMMLDLTVELLELYELPGGSGCKPQVAVM